MNTSSQVSLEGEARVAAAQFVVGTLTQGGLRDLIDAMMYQDIWHDDFAFVLDGRTQRLDEMTPAVAAALRHFGQAMPGKAEAERILLAELLRPIASGEVDPVAGLMRFMEEFHWGWADRASIEDFGESLGVKPIVMDWYQLDDWLGYVPDFLENPAQSDKVAGLKASIVSHANAWVAHNQPV